MRDISPKVLWAFAAIYPEALEPLRRWREAVRTSTWANFAELRQTFGSADRVGEFVVFNIGGNKYRLIAAIHFNTGIIYIRDVLTHKEYDRINWKTYEG